MGHAVAAEPGTATSETATGETATGETATSETPPVESDEAAPAGPTHDDGRLEAVAHRLEEARSAADEVAHHQDITDEARQAEADAARGTEQGEEAGGLAQEGSEIAPA